MERTNALRVGTIFLALTPALALPGGAVRAEDEPVVGSVQWEPGLRPDANAYDKTDYWGCISYSPSTGKYGAACYWNSDANAKRDSKQKCNAEDARPVVLCCNGWVALALGDDKAKYGVGWGPDQKTAEKFALESCKERTAGAKVVFSLNSREPRAWGSIAFSESTGKCGFSCGGGRSSQFQALKFCDAADAKVVATKFDCWMALAVGDKSAYGFGFAGNRADAEKLALEECGKRGANAKIKLSFCTNGTEY